MFFVEDYFVTRYFFLISYLVLFSNKLADSILDFRFFSSFTKNFGDFSTYSYHSHLTLSAPEKLKNSIFEMPIITQTLNISNLRTTSAKSINQHTIRKLFEYSLKNVRQRQSLLLQFSRYCCAKVGRYCDLPSGAQGPKG